jgi:hypothetical protein
MRHAALGDSYPDGIGAAQVGSQGREISYRDCSNDPGVGAQCTGGKAAGDDNDA